MRVRTVLTPEKRVLATLAVIGLCFGPAFAGIVGSKHDFSSRGWGTNEICTFCHAPHNANAPQMAPLWNHRSTTATYALYSSPTMVQTPVQPLNGSRVCLSCHGGDVALDSYGGRIGSQMMAGRANLGTDLSNDHPVSVYWDHQTLAGGVSCSKCHGLHGNKVNSLPFYSRYLECATCHEPHDRFPANTKMLRMTPVGSVLCYQCHGK